MKNKIKASVSAVKAQGANEGIESNRKGASLKQCRQLQWACLRSLWWSIKPRTPGKLSSEPDQTPVDNSSQLEMLTAMLSWDFLDICKSYNICDAENVRFEANILVEVVCTKNKEYGANLERIVRLYWCQLNAHLTLVEEEERKIHLYQRDTLQANGVLKHLMVILNKQK